MALVFPYLKITTLILGLIAAIILIFVRLRQRRTSIIQNENAKSLRQKEFEKACPHYTKVEIEAAASAYIEPDCSQVDPANDSEFGRFAQVREGVFKTVDRFFADTRNRHHLLILADSGVGKTSFCLSYYERTMRLKKGGDFSLVSLASPGVEKAISSIPSKGTTVLLLDALDEDPRAIRQGSDRLHSILKDCSHFRGVLITCRSHFFENDAAIPTATGISRITPRSPVQGGSYELFRLYLLPFTPDQVSKFLNKHFSILAIRERSKARSLVRSIPDLSARPMLLALVPDLVKLNRRIEEVYGLYQYMVDEWLNREEKWISKTVLREASDDIALLLMRMKQDRGVDRCDPNELRNMIEIPETIDWNLLTTRSLLNRDSEGKLKFAHRSIMEFLTVRLAIAGNTEARSLVWTGFMRELLYSYGSTSGENLDVARKLLCALIENRSVTQFPPADPLPEAGERTRSELNYFATRDRNDQGSARDVPMGWRSQTIVWSTDATNGETELFLEDKEFNLGWRIPNVHSKAFQADPNIYRLNMAEAFRGAMPNGYRRPSFAEFISLLNASRFLRGAEVLGDLQFYWIGDKLVTGEHLLVSLHNTLPDSGQLLSSSVRINGQSLRLNLYSVDPRKDARIVGKIRALDLTVCRLSNAVGTEKV